MVYCSHLFLYLASMIGESFGQRYDADALDRRRTAPTAPSRIPEWGVNEPHGRPEAPNAHMERLRQQFTANLHEATSVLWEAQRNLGQIEARAAQSGEVDLDEWNQALDAARDLATVVVRIKRQLDRFTSRTSLRKTHAERAWVFAMVAAPSPTNSAATGSSPP